MDLMEIEMKITKQALYVSATAILAIFQLTASATAGGCPSGTINGSVSDGGYGAVSGNYNSTSSTNCVPCASNSADNNPSIRSCPPRKIKKPANTWGD